MCGRQLFILKKTPIFQIYKLCFDEMRAGWLLTTIRFWTVIVYSIYFQCIIQMITSPKRDLFDKCRNAANAVLHDTCIYLVKPFIKSPCSSTCPTAAGSVNRRLTFNILNHFSFHYHGIWVFVLIQRINVHPKQRLPNLVVEKSTNAKNDYHWMWKGWIILSNTLIKQHQIKIVIQFMLFAV